MRFTSLISTMVYGVALAGCSAEPDYYNCENKLQAMPKAYHRPDDQSQNVEVRLMAYQHAVMIAATSSM